MVWVDIYILLRFIAISPFERISAIFGFFFWLKCIIFVLACADFFSGMLLSRDVNVSIAVSWFSNNAAAVKELASARSRTVSDTYKHTLRYSRRPTKQHGFRHSD